MKLPLPSLNGSEKNLLIWLLIVLPPGFLIVTVFQSTVECPFWDQWDMIPVIERLFNGTLSWHDLWTPHNEHRLLFPYAIMLVFARWTNWTIACEIALNVGFGIALFAILTRLARRSLSRCETETPWWLTPFISLFVFSLTQWENWLWGWQMQIFLNVLSVVAGVYWLTAAPSLRSVILAAAAGIAASFSFGSGLLFWPIGMALIYIQRPVAANRPTRLTIWAAIGTLTVFAYLHDLPVKEGGLTEALRHPVQYGHYIGLFLGAPIVVSIPIYKPFIVWAVGAGGVLLLVMLCLRLYDQSRLSGLVPLITLCVYATLSGCMAGLQRLNLGAMQALSPRYATHATLFWIGLIVLAAIWLQRKGNAAGRTAWQRWARGGALISLALVVIVCGAVGTRRSIARHVQRVSEVRQAIRAGDYSDSTLERIYHNPDFARQQLSVLQRYKLSLFQE
jgi:HAMP domain-containing protein